MGCEVWIENSVTRVHVTVQNLNAKATVILSDRIFSLTTIMVAYTSMENHMIHAYYIILLILCF